MRNVRTCFAFEDFRSVTSFADECWFEFQTTFNPANIYTPRAEAAESSRCSDEADARSLLFQWRTRCSLAPTLGLALVRIEGHGLADDETVDAKIILLLALQRAATMAIMPYEGARTFRFCYLRERCIAHAIKCAHFHALGSARLVSLVYFICHLASVCPFACA